MKRPSPTLASVGLGAIIALAGCSDDPRISDGERFSDVTTGVPGVVLIDNMEDGSQYLLSDDGRVGLWYVYSDESLGSSQQPLQGFPMYRILDDGGQPIPGAAVPPRPCGRTEQTPFFEGEGPEDCAFVARTWGTGQRGWGAGMGLDLNGEGGIKNPFDASAYGGIGFYARGNVRNGALRVNVQDIRTTPESAEAADRRIADGRVEGRCDDSPTKRCNDHFGYGVGIGAEWEWIQVPFSCMASGNWGYPAQGGGVNELLASGVVGIQFQIQGPDLDDNGAPDMVAGMPLAPMAFDFAIDNLSFLDKSLVELQPGCPVP
jgi:hypothetical protein